MPHAQHFYQRVVSTTLDLVAMDDNQMALVPYTKVRHGVAGIRIRFAVENIDATLTLAIQE